MRNAKEILTKYQKGQCTDEERALVERWWLTHRSIENIDIIEEQEISISQELTRSINQGIRKTVDFRRKWIPYVAAAVLAVLLAGVYVTGIYTDKKEKELVAGITPAANKATLTYADGSVLALSEQQQGIVMGDQMTYLDGSVVQISDVKRQQLMLATPKGGIYQAVLPDGTHVWLNAGSTLTYPSSFESDVRMVELEGEAFFEVQRMAKGNALIPFLVKTKTQTIKVLGTAFNVSAYPDDKVCKTTLESGVVEVQHEQSGDTRRLAPGQQSRISSNEFVVEKVDVEAAVAWKYGYFNFDKNDVEEVLKQFSRWYDVAFVYEGKRKNLKLSGNIHRYVTADKALAILSYFDLKYELDNTQNKIRIRIADN